MKDALKKILVPPPTIEFTGCCALSQLRVCALHTEGAIKAAIKRHEREVERVWDPRLGYGGAPTLFAVLVMPHEQHLAPVMEKVGFVHRFSFPRRKGYPEGVNTFWTYSIPVKLTEAQAHPE